MARRRSGRRKAFKVKLKKNTIYSIFGIGSLLAAGLFFLSFTRNGESAIAINDVLTEKFGATAFLFPFVPVFFGLMFLHLKMFLSRPNVAIG